jgi:DHA2 family multidrug resistance protein
MDAADFAPVPNKTAITVCVMLATLMQVLDTTIANVALPHMQGSLSATQDQISWILTSYIVASAIMTLPTGWLAGRFGRKKIFLASIAGFTLASMLCGLATSISEMVLFRLAQGAFGAALIPISQAILLDINPKEKHGSAMAIWGIGIMIGPVLGPTLGGWLTEYYNWRWVFYINVPVGILSFLGVMTFLTETDPLKRPFDMLGFLTLSLAIGGLQLLLDRGQSKDWFASYEILIYCGLVAGAVWMYAVHSLQTEHPFLHADIMKDRNFATALVFIFFVGIILLATLALLPPFLQNLMNYPVLDVGIVMAPRGIGTALAMIIVGRLSNKVDARAMIFLGLVLTAYSLWQMAQFSVFVPKHLIVTSGAVQGLGLGFIFVPLSTIAYATLAPQHRTEAAGLFSLVRNMGSSIGISIVTTILLSSTQINHAYIGESMSIFNMHPLLDVMPQAMGNGSNAVMFSFLNAEVTRQASAIAYLNNFRLMMWVVLLAIPLTFLLRVPKRTPDFGDRPAMVGE